MGADAGQLINYCLRHAGIDLPDLTAIATNTPWGSIQPQFALQDPSSAIHNSLPPFVTVPHHLAHAEYVLHYSSSPRSLVLICDGSGTYEKHRKSLDIQEDVENPIKFIRDSGKESISAYAFDDERLRLVYRVAYGEAFSPDLPDTTEYPPNSRWLASLGQLWRWAASYCHGDSNEAGKVMGLAPFGDPEVHSDLDTLSIGADGKASIKLREICTYFKKPNSARADVTGCKHYEDIAAHIQHETNKFLVKLVQFLQTLYPTDCVCYGGGVALNGIANEYLKNQLSLNLQMNGSCEDNGTAIGAALAAHHALTGERVRETVTDYYGCNYSGEDIEKSLQGYSGTAVKLSRPDLLKHTSQQLSSGKVVGWFQGRSEFGPRALGNRSILADPRNSQMQDILNRTIKFREAFRPYAPAVTEERANDFFVLNEPSPVMLGVVPVRGDCLPAIRHIDGTARVQTVNRTQNKLFYDLLKAFETETGTPVLLNTSFNRAGEPIVESPTDAVRTFSASKLDCLVMDNFVVTRD